MIEDTVSEPALTALESALAEAGYDMTDEELSLRRRAAMAFDEEPDDPHGECRAEIERLHARLEKRYEREREAHAANLIEQRARRRGARKKIAAARQGGAEGCTSMRVQQ